MLCGAMAKTLQVRFQGNLEKAQEAPEGLVWRLGVNVQEFDIRAYLDATRVPYWEAGLNVGQGWLGLQCVYCDDQHNHLGVNLYHKSFSCWLCHTTGSITDLICELEKVNYSAALDRLEEFQSFEHVDAVTRTRLEDDGLSVLPLDCRPLTHPHRTFLGKRRGFNPKRLVRDWGLLSGPVVGKWKHRIIIPVVLDGRIMTFVGMDHTGHNPPKYKAAPVEESFMPTSELVYGADYVRHTAVVVEGVADAWRIGKGAVATFGMTPGHKRMVHLTSLPARYFYVMFDGEEQATDHALALVAELKAAGKQAKVLGLEPGLDPDMLEAQEVSELRHKLNLDI